MAQPNWITPAGSLGLFPTSVYLSTLVFAIPMTFPADSITYVIIAGSLPPGITLLSTNGLISGTPTAIADPATYTFTIRATDNLGNLRDRTFSISITGAAIVSFITPPGRILSSNDSVWVETKLEYSNPIPSDPVTITLLSGNLPPGLQITPTGIIHGYPAPPVATVSSPYVATTLVATAAITNEITCSSTDDFFVGRPIVFTGPVYGGLVSGTTYYITAIISNTNITISSTNNGPNFILGNGSGFGVTVTLAAVQVGLPIISTFSFSLSIANSSGSSSQTYSITIINQNTPTSQGGPGLPTNTRIPTLLNTRPLSTPVINADPYYGYYLFPATNSSYYTYPSTVNAHIGTIRSNNYFAFKVIGHDFDGSSLIYSYTGLPTGLTGDPLTGWITGTPILTSSGLSQYSFGVSVSKITNSIIQSLFFKFDYYLSNEIDGVITWISPINLGTLQNGGVCTKSIRAESDVPLVYELSGGIFPPNLVLLSTGEITDNAAFQPTSSILVENDQTVFTFTVKAFSLDFAIIQSFKEFTITINQSNVPTDILYIKATPSIPDRQIIDSLLSNTELIPDEALYRANDPNFGKASEVIYQHAFGIHASDINQYLSAIALKNHYWRDITLGELATAIARDENGEIVYEVVYSKIIDNLQNPSGESISKEIDWPRFIDLNQGSWYTSITDIYTSYASILGQDYYTSLTPGYARILYPNALANMRTQVRDVLGQEQNSRVLPLWMTSQQVNGSTLGYTQAWVICYTKPGEAETIKNNINTTWKQPDGLLWKLNMINFKIDRFFVDKRLTYNYNNITVPPSWTGLPSATPTPDPRNSKDFYAVFPRTTILPSTTQY